MNSREEDFVCNWCGEPLRPDDGGRDHEACVLESLAARCVWCVAASFAVALMLPRTSTSRMNRL
jgi:hypothetical protein